MDVWLNKLNDVIWSQALVYLCLATGLYFSIRTRFMQLRGVPEMLRLMVHGHKSDAGVSSFQGQGTREGLAAFEVARPYAAAVTVPVAVGEPEGIGLVARALNEIDEHSLEYSDRITGAELCADLARRERSLLVIKQEHAAAFTTAAGGCEATELQQVGAFDADGHRLEVYAARPRYRSPPAGATG